MGLIQAIKTSGIAGAVVGAGGSVLADQWKEYFYCDAMDKNVLMTVGQKKTTKNSANTKGSDNIISNGSRIAVADGQCMIIVDNGKIVEVCAEPGEFTYDTSTEPSIFYGGLGKGIVDSFKKWGERITFGGDTARVQKVYYFNLLEIMDNKFGTPNPVMFRAVDKNIGLDLEVNLRCNGTYSYRLTDPLVFYKNVAGNIADGYYTRDKIDAQLKAEFIDALGTGLAEIADLEIRPNQLPKHTEELKNAMNNALAESWARDRGISIEKIAMSIPTLTPEDMKMIQDLQRASAMGNSAAMMAGTMTAATADAMKTAAGNSAGAMTGFMGMGFAQNAAGANTISNLAAQAQQQQAGPAPQAAPQMQAAGVVAAAGWKCGKCGKDGNTGKFCAECGEAKPADAAGWTCSCGAVNKGKFCQECGAKKPEGAPLYRCDKCGWEPADPHNPPKFCPECGDIFDDNDKV